MNYAMLFIKTNKVILSNYLYLLFHLKVSFYYVQDLVCDTLKNACDLSLPLKALGYLPNVNPALIAFLGTMSSIFGIFPLVNPEYKMP